jgi:hypothetical protein
MTANELELLACFGVEPTLLEPGDPWFYNDAVYSMEVGGLSVSFAVQPSCRDVRLIVRLGGRRHFEFNAMGVDDMRVIDERGIDAIVLTLAERSWLRVQLRPAFEITQGHGLDA